MHEVEVTSPTSPYYIIVTDVVFRQQILLVQCY